MSTRSQLPKGPLFSTRGMSVRPGGWWGKLHPLWKTLLIVAVLAALALPFFGSAKKVYKSQRYESDFASAKQALAAGEDVKARDLSLALLRSHPKKTEVLPIFMRAAVGAADSRLVGVARGYLSLDTGDNADRLFAWHEIAKQSPMGIAGLTWMSMHKDEKANPEFLIPWLERLMTEDLSQEVEAVLAEHSAQADPRMERIRLAMLAKRGTEVSLRELQARLLDRLANHPENGPMLLPALDEVPHSAVIPYFFTGLGEWLKSRTGEPAVEDQLRLARCEIAANPEAMELVVTRTVAAYAAKTPLAVAKWCATLKRFEQAETLLEPLMAKSDSAAFMLMAEVLERLGKVDEWDKLLETPPVGVSLPEILCDRAFIAAQRGDERAQPKFEQEAVAAAELRAKSDSLILLARHATRRGMSAYAEEIWVKAIRSGPTSPLPFFSSISHVVESLARNRNESKLVDVLSVYRFLEPANVDAVTQFLYLGCLTGNVTPARVLTELAPFKANIQSLQLDCTIAFAHLLEGDYATAEKLTHDTSIDWFIQVPALRAIRAIILTKIGSKQEADIYLEDFPWASLLPCETRVFRELLEESKLTDEIEHPAKAEETEAAKVAMAARLAERNKITQSTKDAIAAMEAKQAGESEESKSAERAKRADQSKRVEQARQAQRTKDAEAVRIAKQAKAKDAEPNSP